MADSPVIAAACPRPIGQRRQRRENARLRGPFDQPADFRGFDVAALAPQVAELEMRPLLEQLRQRRREESRVPGGQLRPGGAPFRLQIQGLAGRDGRGHRFPRRAHGPGRLPASGS